MIFMSGNYASYIEVPKPKRVNLPGGFGHQG
jgi:hypothetical protein